MQQEVLDSTLTEADRAMLVALLEVLNKLSH